MNKGTISSQHETLSNEHHARNSSSFSIHRSSFSSILRPSSVILAIIVFIVLLYGVIYPNLHVLTASLESNGEWSLTNYREALSLSATLEAVASSIALSLLTVLFCAAVGVSLAFLFERYTFPARRIFATL